MKDQHTMIKGYRDLTQEEIDLMNKIKEKGQELLDLQALLVEKIRDNFREVDSDDELFRLNQAEPSRWAAIGKTHIQEGISALVRAVAQPTSC